MSLWTLAFSLVFFNFFEAQASFEIFHDEVHPILQSRCVECHGVYQTPLHSVNDVEQAYQAALPLINLNFPESSKLWTNSFSNHCGNESLCGVQDQNFLQGIKNWIEGEKQNSQDPFQYYAQATAPIPTNIEGQNEQTFLFQLASGIEIEMTVVRLSEQYIYFTNPKLKNSPNYISFDGFEVRSSEVVTKQQNFAFSNTVAKPTETEELIPLTPFGSGYILTLLPDAAMESVRVELYIKEFNINLGNIAAQEKYNEGYYLPYTQYDFAINQIASGRFHNCVLTKRQGFIKCWGRGEYGRLGYGDRQIRGDEFGEMGENLPHVDLGGEKVKSLALGVFHSCALLESDRVKCWGIGSSGQLGYGDNERRGDEPGEMGNDLPYVDLSLEAVFN